MPEITCICGKCRTCYKREQQRAWRARHCKAVEISEEEILSMTINDGISDAELDHRALSTWRPEWGLRARSGDA